MELSWLMRIRIIAAFAVGVLLVGLLPYSLVRPPADGVFAILSGSINISDLLICAALAFAAGFIASAICTPFGAQIGILAAPAGMVVWAIKSADLSTLFQAAPAVNDRLAVYSSLRFESFVWLAIAGFGAVGALIADKFLNSKTVNLPDKFDPAFKLPTYAAIIIAVIGTIVVSNLLINILAAGIRYTDIKVGHVTGQPANFQIAFAVLVAFMACGFLAKLLIGVSFWFPAASSVAVTIYSIISYSKKPAVEYLCANWPAVFFIKSIVSVLPIQMVAFGCIGAVWGYWLAARFHLWRTLES